MTGGAHDGGQGAGNGAGLTRGRRRSSTSSVKGGRANTLTRGVRRIEHENRVLNFLGYLGRLGASANTIRQHLFAIKNARKRAGCGDPTEDMHRIWILANAMDQQAVRRPRRLGVTPNMLEWLGHHVWDSFEGKEGAGKGDAAIVMTAMEVAWFCILRAKEYTESNGIDEGMIVRGCDFWFSGDGI